MKIRTRVLILLLAIAVLPVVLVRATDAIGMYALGQEVAERSRSELSAAAQAELERIISAFTRTVDREARLLAMIIERQADAAADLLNGPLPETPPPPSYSEDAFSDPGHPQHDALSLSPSVQHGRLLDDGSTEPQLVSDEFAVLRLSSDADPDDPDVARQIDALAHLQPVYRELYSTFPERLLWLYTSLESGVHQSFPGKAGYPDEYDPRTRDWYQLTRESGRVQFFSPVADVTTGRSLVTVSAPLYDADGAFLGVTALDVPLQQVLDSQPLPNAWRESVDVLLVTMTSMDEEADVWAIPPEERDAIVVAERQPAPERMDWREPAEFRVIEAPTPEALALIENDMWSLATTTRRMDYLGEPSIWAYGPIIADPREPVYLFLIVPERDVAQLADQVEQFVIDRTWLALEISGLIIVIVVLSVLAVAFLVSRAITRPIIRLADAATDIAEGNLDARVPEPNRGDELGRMARAFNNMAPKLRDRIRIRDSLHLAMQVQQSLLPSTPPKPPGLDIAGESIYCDETGGDYYDFIEYDEIDRARLGVAIGDVAGHGVAAALLMATVRALLRSRASLPGSLAELFGDVNRQLCTSDFSGRFMTLFFLLIDTGDRSFRYISAGHDPAILYRPSTDEFIEYAGQDIPLGVEDDWVFHELAADAREPGDVIILGTDGIWECVDEQGRMFGKERLREVVRAAADGSAQHISAAVRESLFAFRGACEQRDDITLVVIKFVP